MNNLQLIEGLCNQIEIQNEIIKHLATRLAEISALTEEEQREINVARAHARRYQPRGDGGAY